MTLQGLILVPAYNTGAVQGILSKDGFGLGALRDYTLVFLAGGALTYGYSADGITYRAAIASVTTQSILSANKFVWFRATYETATGKVNFAYSFDKVTWVAIGVEQTITAGAINASTSPLCVGSQGTGSITTGKVLKGEVYAGIGGAAVLKGNFDPNNHVTGATWADLTTGVTWTANGATSIR